MRPEVLFLKYSYPCCFTLVQRREMDKATMNELERAAINDEVIERSILEKIFFRAISRMRALAREKNRDCWSQENIREYFLQRHNDMLEGKIQGEQYGSDIDENLPPAFRELCKVYKATIIKKERGYFVVRFGDKTRPVINSLIPEARVGDKITIHYGYACEKL